MIKEIQPNEKYEKSTFHETRETVSRLREPLKIKTVAVKLAGVRGHMLEITANVSWGEIDSLSSEMTEMIKVWIDLINGPMKSEYLGMIKQE